METSILSRTCNVRWPSPVWSPPCSQLLCGSFQNSVDAEELAIAVGRVGQDFVGRE